MKNTGDFFSIFGLFVLCGLVNVGAYFMFFKMGYPLVWTIFISGFFTAGAYGVMRSVE